MACVSCPARILLIRTGYCPKGDDPLTFCQNTVSTEVQEIKLSGYTSALTADELSFSWQDSQGEMWTTQRIAGMWGTNAKDTIKAALENLPNFIIPSVTVSDVVSTTMAGATPETRAYRVTFTSDRNKGSPARLTPPIWMNPAGQNVTIGCNTAGCQPRTKQPRAAEVLACGTGTACATATTHVVLRDEGNILPPTASTTSGNWDLQYRLEFSGTPLQVKVLEAVNKASLSTDADWTNDGTQIYPAGTGTVEIPAAATSFELGTHGVVVNLAGGPTDQKYVVRVSVPTVSVTQVQTPGLHFENYECSGRGTCDRDTGKCTCFSGYYSDNCSKQSVLV